VAAYTAVQWNLIVSGKPIVALVPFFIVGFEFTVLFAIFGNVIGLIHQMQLPGFKGLEHYDPRCSGEHFGITASCEAGDLEKLKAFFQTQGGEVKVFSA
jgi:molybdopterin-containing oxidoreductase family membrane subunit